MKHKKNYTEGRKAGGRRKRREWMFGAGLIAYLIGLLIRIPLGRIIGDKGIGFFAAGMEVFAVATVVLSYGMSKSVSILIKYRVKREMYKSAAKVFKNAIFFTVICGALIACGIFAFSGTIAETLVLEQMSYLAIAAAAPAVFLASVMGILKGYFQGMGTMIPSVHSKLLEKFMLLAAGLIFGFIFYEYGLKVAGLLKNEEYASAYGALGACAGLTAACVFGLVHLLFIRMVYAGTFRQQVINDSSKNVESGGRIMSMLISTSLPYTICGLLYNMNYLVDERVFNYVSNVQGKSAVRVLHWGVYYGKYSVVAGIAAILCLMTGFFAIPKIVQAFDRQEFKEAQNKLGRTVHQMAVISIPCAVLLAVLAEPVVGVLFKGEIKTAVRLLQAGSAVIVLLAFTYFLAGILLRIRKIRVVIFAGLIGFLAHLILLIALINNTKLGIVAVAYGTIGFYLVACIICYIGVMKFMQYTQEWVRTFAVTAVAAGVAGLIGMLLNRALFSFAGGVITLVVALPICLIVYNVLLIVLRGVSEEELEEMPGGRVVVSIAARLHLM